MRKNMDFLFVRVIVAATFIGSLLLAGPVHATSHDFYAGKTVRIVVGFSAGGGFDAYARAISRHMSRHIPGNPTIIVENMAGAGSLISANHVYKVAKPDGLTLGHFHGGVLLSQILGRPGIEFDARRFEYIGVPVKDDPVCATTKASGITSVEKWMASKTPIKFGATGPGVVGYDNPKILEAALGLPIQLISGYKWTADVRLAVEGGEVAGACLGWDSLKTTWARALESGEVVVVIQNIPKRHPELPSVPTAIELAKTDEAKKLIDSGMQVPAITNRPYVAPPGTPKERVQLLRKAFADTMKDPEFLADAKKSKLEIDPLSGEEVENLVTGRLFKVEPSVLARLKEILAK